MTTKNGFTLIEILLVLAIFSVIGVIVAQSMFVILRSSRKSEAVGRVRENVSYALAVMDRHLHSARSIACPSTTRVDYTDSLSESGYFSCDELPTGFIASNSATARLTSPDIEITSCRFACSSFVANNPAYLEVVLTARDKNTLLEEGSLVETRTRIYLRSY